MIIIKQVKGGTALIIGQFVDTFPPCLDGVGRVVLSYCQTLTQMGHTAYYVAPNSPEDNESYGIPLILSKSMPVKGELFRAGLPMLDPKFRRRVDQIPFDIVHAHSPFLAAAEAQRVAKKRDIPLVSSFHSKYYDDALAKTHSEAMAKTLVRYIVKLYDKCDGVWTVNNATADVLHSYGYKGEILVMENGTNREELDENALAAMRRRLPHIGDAPMLLFVGQHNYKKNLHGVLGACALLKKRGQRFHLVLAGNGPDYDAIVHESMTLGIADECHFMGFMQDRAELMALYSMADLFVFPSLYDNAPMVLREAAVMGTPGLLVRGSCSAEGVVDGENGFISPDETAESIADTIQRALPLAKVAGEKARETIPISWLSIMEKVEKEYERLIRAHK